MITIIIEAANYLLHFVKAQSYLNYHVLKRLNQLQDDYTNFELNCFGNDYSVEYS